MTDPIFNSTPRAGGPLDKVRTGMAVYDRSGDKVGEVTQVFFGTGDQNIEQGIVQRANLGSGAEPVAGGGDSYDASLEGSRYAENDLPEVLRHRLEGHGFIRIDTGMLQSDRFAMPEDIASVTGDRVNLNVPKERLTKA